MSNTTNENLSRRDVIKTTAGLATASALAGFAVPLVHAAGSNTIQVALVGCGGRGTGAARNALSTKNGPIKLVAMADVFQNRLGNSYKHLQRSTANQVEVPERSAVHRLRRLQEGDGLPQAGRRGHPRHAARLPLGPLRLRHREGPATSSWRSRPRWTAPAPRRCSSWPRSRSRRTSRSASA